MVDLVEYVDGLPNISGSEERIRQAIQASRTAPVFLPQGAQVSVRSTAPSLWRCTCTSHSSRQGVLSCGRHG